MTTGPSTACSSELTPTASSKPNCAEPSPPGAGGNASRSSLPIGVNSQPGAPRKVGSSIAPSAASARSRRAASQLGEVAALANGALHLELDEAVHLDRVLHRQLLDDRLDEAVHDQLGGLLLVDAVRHQVEELLLADLRNRGLVADVDVFLADADRRVRVRAALLVEQQRVADDLRLRAVRALGAPGQTAGRRAPPA